MPDLSTLGAGAAGGGMLGLILKWLHGSARQNHEHIEKLEKMFYEAEIRHVQNFVTKEDLRMALAPISTELEKISGKLDNINDKK